MGARQCGRVERLRDEFWLGVAAGECPDGELVLVCERSVALVVCPFGHAIGRGVVVTVSLDRGGPLAALHKGGAAILAMDAMHLWRIVGVDFEMSPGATLPLVEGREDAPSFLNVPGSAEQMLAACSLRDCGLSGAVRNVYMKGKALEFLALVFAALKMQGRSDPAEGLSSRDVDRMLRARDLLLARYEEPPVLAKLAVSACVCETRLKLGFKRVFGATPFALLRRHRMAVVRDLLVLRGYRLSEAAVAVGYTNVSHFIYAFVREYGVRPGELARRGRADAVVAEPTQ